MRYRECAQCGEMYMMEEDLCADCLEAMRVDFLSVKEFLFTHPGATAVAISEGTGIDEDRVLYMLDAGWLMAQETEGTTFLRCRMCGSPTLNPMRLCTKCAETTQQSLQNLLSQHAPGKKRRGMVTRDREV